MMELGQVRSFVAVADDLHFTRAAVRLNMSQSPLSRHVQSLERSLGVQLLTRTSRTVALTAAGQAFLLEARRLLEAASRAERVARDTAVGLQGTLRLGFTSAAAHEVLPQLAIALQEQLPRLELTLEQLVTSEQLAALASRRLDAGLMRPSAVAPGSGVAITSSVLRRERLLLALPAGHAKALDGPPTLACLDGQPLITWSPVGGAYFDVLLSALFRHAGIRPRTVQRVNETHTILSLVRAGLGAALVPESVRHLGVGGIELHDLALPSTFDVEMVMAWRSDDPNPALARLREVATELFPGD